MVSLGPVIVDHFLRVRSGNRDHDRDRDRGRREKKTATRELTQFLAAAAAVFASIAFLNFLFFSPGRILSFAKYLGTQVPAVASPIGNFVIAAAETTIVPWTGYLQGGIGPDASPWYAWPVMQLPMQYLGTQMMLFGDPVLWLGSTIAVIFAIALLWRHWRERTLLILLGGYAASLLPFFTFVHRPTFLYHYFPALLFAFGLLAWMLSRWLGFGGIAALTRRQWFFLFIIVVLVGAGFLAVAPLTYGL